MKSLSYMFATLLAHTAQASPIAERAALVSAPEPSNITSFFVNKFDTIVVGSGFNLSPQNVVCASKGNWTMPTSPLYNCSDPSYKFSIERKETDTGGWLVTVNHTHTDGTYSSGNARVRCVGPIPVTCSQFGLFQNITLS